MSQATDASLGSGNVAQGRRQATQPEAQSQDVRPQRLAIAAFIVQRLAFAAVVLGIITFVSFLGLEMARGASFGQAARYAVEASAAYLGQVVQGNLGVTSAGSVSLRPVPVAGVLASVVPKSVGLLAVSLFFATLTGITLGLASARRRHGAASWGFILLSIVGVSIPSFFAALLLQLLMIRWAQAAGQAPLPVGGFGWDSHLVLPALVLAARPVAQIARMTFIAVGSVLGLDYVRTAAGKGLVPRHIWSQHVVRNAAIPILTTVGVSLRFALSSLPVVEYFFGWPGIGFTLLKSISQQDDNLTVALVLCLGIIFITVNFLLDLGYRFLDPQLRESVARVGRLDARTLRQALLDAAASLGSFLAHNPLADGLRRLAQPAPAPAPPPNPFRQILAARPAPVDEPMDLYRRQRRRAWWRGTAGNLPLVLGGALVLLLLWVVFMGPRMTPHNPYMTQGLTIVDGKFLVPPFAPDETYPLGTDVLGRDVASLILAGAQQTLILAALAVAFRMLVGFVLGALAGWRAGSGLDRVIVGAAEVLAAFPALILAMIVILALGIRQGMQPFIFALCLVGWGETMQYVRGEVMAIRPKLYIESAVAVGVRTSRLMVAHVLPILLAALISMAALEMGAVLMLLGELGFVGIFIGGGAFAELQVGSTLYHYSDVPEWASLLSSVRLYARSYPWVAIYPALAFFFAIVGFNLLGEGLRRMVETVGVGFGRLFNRYTLIAAAVAVLAFGWARANTGSMAYYRQHAQHFDGQAALVQIETLTSPALEGRSLGSQGMEDAAGWIAGQFNALGLQPAGQDLTYFQNRARAFTIIDGVPQLGIDDGGPSPVYRQDYAEYPGHFNGVGQAAGQVRAVLTHDLQVPRTRRTSLAVEQAVNTQDILLVLSQEDARQFEFAPRAGLLIVANDPVDLRRHFTIAGTDRIDLDYFTGKERGTNTPALWISQALADRILQPAGETVASLRQRAVSLGPDGVALVDTGTTVALDVAGTLVEQAQARHVLGYWPGSSGRAGSSESGFDTALPGGASMDPREVSAMDDEMVVVLAQYDSPPPAPDGRLDAANFNASGVAVLLEAVRAMQQAGYQPYRSFLFVAYAGEGLDGGEVVRPEEVSKFLQAKAGFVSAFDVEAIVILRGLGAGAGDRLMISAGGNQRLASLFETAARRVGAPAQRADNAVDMSIIFADRAIQQGGGQEAPIVTLSWEGWQASARTPGDTASAISPAKLEQAGRALSLALMIVGRENRY